MMLILIGYLTNVLLLLLMIRVTQSNKFGSLEYITTAIPFGVLTALIGMFIYVGYLEISDQLKK